MNIPDIPQAWKDEIAQNPDSEFSKRAKAVRQRIAMVNISEAAIRQKGAVSQIGTRLLFKFKDRVGAVPCSACKATIRQLNQMTLDQVELDHDKIVDKIFENAQNAKMTWWAKVAAFADSVVTGGLASRTLISMWLREATTEEKRNAV
jgi:hypothetical protein